MVAWLGTGLLGSGFVRALLKRGEPVHVWNRSRNKAQALEADGATVFTDPAGAVRGAARVHLCLSDDSVVDDVLELARPGFAEGVVVVDHTTTSPAGTAARVKRWTERGVAFQHAPVFMGPPNALARTGFMLASGDEALFRRLEPELAQMTGKVLYFGPVPERAAGMKLLGNSFLIAMLAGISDLLALAKSLDIPSREVVALFETFNPGAQLPARMQRVLTGDYDHPSWNLAMARKDARLMIEAAGRANVPLHVMPVAAAEMDRWLAAGHAADDWTIIATPVIR